MWYNNVFVMASAVHFVTGCIALDVPDNIKTFYKTVRNQKDCKNKLATGYESWLDGPTDWSYCGDHLADYGVIYIQGPEGQLTNMDIDCDGIQRAPNDGQCGHNPSDQDVTAMRDSIQGYNVSGLHDLDPYVHPYVVFGNSGSNPGNIPFDPTQYGVQPLSLILVVTPDVLVCAIWGDTNGGERDASFVGEAALATGQLAFGFGAVNGTVSHEPNDVLYLAFTGEDAVPGAHGAAWGADTKEQFMQSVEAQCLKVAQRIGGGTATATATGTATAIGTATGTATLNGTGTGTLSGTTTVTPNGGNSGDSGCSWKNHCVGSSCRSNSDCSDDLSCQSGKCAAAKSGPVCKWTGHCEGAFCQDSKDCDGDMVCKSGKCGQLGKLRFVI